MSPESEIRSRYLALALDARKVIDILITFVEEGTRDPGFDDSLQAVIESLEATEKKDVFSPARNRLAFSEYYEQVRTVQEALKEGEIRQIIQKLAEVKSNKTRLPRQRDDAFEAIKLLSAIESRALYHYRPQP
jgi:hypothetical protein